MLSFWSKPRPDQESNAIFTISYPHQKKFIFQNIRNQWFKVEKMYVPTSILGSTPNSSNQFDLDLFETKLGPDKKFDTVFRISDPRELHFKTLLISSSQFNFDLSVRNLDLWAKIRTGSRIWCNIQNQQPKKPDFDVFVWYLSIQDSYVGSTFVPPFWGRLHFSTRRKLGL